jgi:hypothetical protein
MNALARTVAARRQKAKHKNNQQDILGADSFHTVPLSVKQINPVRQLGHKMTKKNVKLLGQRRE